MTDLRVSEAGVEVLFGVTPDVRVSQAGVEVAHAVVPGMQISQAGVEVLFSVTPAFAISQAGVEVLFAQVPCNTQWTQIWTITRTDGEVLRFTALDRDLPYRGQTYRSCHSMNPSASENVGSIDDSGTMNLSGLLASGAISQEDLHAGLYDGATVQAELVSWNGPALARPLLKGTFGKVVYSENRFSVDLEGDGGRLQQTPLVHPMQPNCRYLFGDRWCSKDLGPLTVAGAVTTSGGQKGFADAGRAEAAGYFRSGRVTFTSGANAGISAEIKDHEAGGSFSLWPRMAFPIATGDTYTMTPGCTNNPDGSNGCRGCKDWGNFINYGGEPDVPGNDKVREQPDVKK